MVKAGRASLRSNVPSTATLSRATVLQVSQAVGEPLSDVQLLMYSTSGVAGTHLSPLQVSIAMGEPDANMDALMNKMERLQTQIDAVDGFDLDRQLERAMDALRCPPGDLGVRQRCRIGA